MAASLFLLIAAAVSLAGEEEGADPSATALLKRGWQRIDHLDCAAPTAGSYFEVSNDQGSAEAFALNTGYLVSRSPVPEPPYDCRLVRKPHFVEEI